MQSMPVLRPILQDESLTRGLGDIEARMLIEWIAEWTDLLAETAACEATARARIHRLCRRARGIARFVYLWCEEEARSAALQLAASENFQWPLPTGSIDPGDLMAAILEWENEFAGEEDLA